MGTGKDALRLIVVALLASAALAGVASPAQAAECSLTGSGPEGATDASLFQKPAASLKASMIFVDFPMDAASGAETAPDTTLGADLGDWAADYLDEVSYGRTQLDLLMGTAWIQMGSPAAAYGATSFAAQRAYIAEAVHKADLAGFNFTGRQTVYVVAAPTGGDLPNSPAFSAFSGDGITVDGTQIRWGATLGDDIRRTDLDPDYGSHILVHETGHTFGLPDLYRYGQPFAAAHLDAGAWDLMGWIGPGLHMTGWHKQKLGWLAPNEWRCVEGDVTAQLTPMASPGGTKMLVTRVSPTVAYAAEVRGPVGHDAGMCDNGGVLIYRIDSNAAGGFASGVAPIQVKLANPGAPDDPSSTVCSAIRNAPFGVGGGETSHFAEGPVTVDVLSGSPAMGYSVRMTGPVLQQPGTVAGKVKVKGLKRAKVAVGCPAGGGACTGKATLKLGRKTLGTGSYSLQAGQQITLKIAIGKSGRRALAGALRRKKSAKGSVILSGPGGATTTKVKLVA